MKETGKIIIENEKEFTIIQMEKSMKVIGKMERKKAKESTIFQMEIGMKENIKMI